MDPQRCYVVLGATGDIGSGLCRMLRASGASVLAAGRTPDRVQALTESCGARPYTLDATDFHQVQECLADALHAFGRIDGIANCVGSLLLKPAHFTTEAEWQAVLAANLTTAFATVCTGSQAMMNDGGSIVLVSSAAARVGLANHEAVAAAKAGVIGLMLSAAATYAPRGIRVNCVAPGLVQTPMTQRLTSSPASRKVSEAMHPLGRIGQPADVASAIAWLLAPEQSWVTGQVIGIDGGLANVRPR